MKYEILFLSLTACSGDVFTGVIPDANGEGDAGKDSASDADADAACTSGTTACQETWAAYCSRLKTCCAGQCGYAWANDGGTECVNHYLAANYCAANRANDKRCDQACLVDIEVAGCIAIMNQAGVPQVSNACQTYWQ